MKENRRLIMTELLVLVIGFVSWTRCHHTEAKWTSRPAFTVITESTVMPMGMTRSLEAPKLVHSIDGITDGEGFSIDGWSTNPFDEDEICTTATRTKTGKTYQLCKSVSSRCKTYSRLGWGDQ